MLKLASQAAITGTKSDGAIYTPSDDIDIELQKGADITIDGSGCNYGINAMKGSVSVSGEGTLTVKGASAALANIPLVPQNAILI